MTMREIKFRGKCIPEFPHPVAKWVYGSFVSGKLILSPYKERNEKRNFWYEVDPETVGQFTGIKDISDADIYEGDIITFKDIETDEYARGVVLQSVDGTWRVVYEELSVPLWDVRKTALILGNIHDAPELLGADHERG